MAFFKAASARTVKTTTKILENVFWIYSTSTDHFHWEILAYYSFVNLASQKMA